MVYYTRAGRHGYPSSGTPPTQLEQKVELYETPALTNSSSDATLYSGYQYQAQVQPTGIIAHTYEGLGDASRQREHAAADELAPDVTPLPQQSDFESPESPGLVDGRSLDAPPRSAHQLQVSTVLTVSPCSPL